ncbi:hypothetical protein RhiirA4_448309 [Rhizophagus irregularis]|uniref:Uncharacterized protein n=1 Tax=Rhizophagus irregularis TaxID=588596 RepID=A0A2I1H8P1_9GLOM|nr:hypothetical protein RhiirA4_444004 [Rhizophagus irregularis]PKY55224.1 hypothetical protein RhiirA4_448309 [Rhizophagus irregularis]
MSELYNKGTSDFNSNMEEKEQVESNNDIESENQTNEIQTNGNTNEIQTNKIQTNEIQTNEIQTNEIQTNEIQTNDNQIYENQTNENDFKVPEDEEKKSKNKKNFVGTVKDKKFDKNDKNDNKGQFQKQEYDNDALFSELTGEYHHLDWYLTKKNSSFPGVAQANRTSSWIYQSDSKTRPKLANNLIRLTPKVSPVHTYTYAEKICNFNNK